eukprot:Cvel_3255.t1-p1 / transcript=Cvel_3255.t1 / gene=Cvel_3255 / organism=Chromera_velia_CCMP2878 / gene_product=hypothetical protein / transcript_product=hypothetical protein / location=Cvel_scaffold127:130276-133268(+) / protein_length=105 / sequence_SO=supercontig / SO=protein_coding / is_pseudo=false
MHVISAEETPETSGTCRMTDLGSDFPVITKIVGGLQHFCAVGKHQNVGSSVTPRRAKCWGRGTEGQLRPGGSGNAGMSSSSIGDSLPFALENAGSAVDEDDTAVT